MPSPNDSRFHPLTWLRNSFLAGVAVVLPFVVTVNRVGGQLRLWSIAEWQFRHSPDYPTYTMLMQVSEGQLRLTEDRPALPLDLPDGFW